MTPLAGDATTPLMPIIGDCKLDLALYEAIYKDLHQNPELAFQEHRTAARAREFLQDLSSDFEIHTSIAKTGQIAILRNGDGPNVMLRADMDALPLQEKTGLPYASTKKVVGADSSPQFAMHACGHDVHVTCLLGAAEALLKTRDEWSGTVTFLFQPAEEGAGGAQAMVDDGLYTRHGCPVPDVLFAQHVGPLRAGSVSVSKGPLMAASDGFRVTVHGRGGHASMPHFAIDPVLIASHIIVRLQSIVSREVPPSEQAVLSVCSVEAVSAENVIPESASILINVRSLSEKWREAIIDSIMRIARVECSAGQCPKEPTIERTQSMPMTINSDAVSGRVMDAFRRTFGPSFLPNLPAVTGSEDVSILASSVGAPYCFWFFGGHEPALWDEHYERGSIQDLPYNHSPYFAPAIHPTLETGIRALVTAAMCFISKDSFTRA